jgi:DNA-binding NarL/FixJ family response regulator
MILTTTGDAREVERCRDLGCNGYIQKPMSYNSFADTMTKLGRFVTLLQIPRFS